ncbi:major facilitator superfamily domain-containing protein [Truncatella angustata]|uniref:Major facilitator superfamily domain-containing protein n=1 Tax=Truncatella angustata TaxID=152316 RepID=A0A9P8UW80_9PEZI|nr:major facilitator superfamily domain-containing protein [Truncatella angustata]KAH6659144.1 major facilitator superfamily domain-containing protein [Truncatella angustata]KAH8204896.1 hypothetical protein TruAng_000935 [Truncatella angustata]
MASRPLSPMTIEAPLANNVAPAGPSVAIISTETQATNSHQSISRSRTVFIISCITCITGIGSLLGGLLTVCIPVIAKDLRIPQELQLWPAAAFALASGCTLLPCGAAADVLGCRRAVLFGALLQVASTVGAGLANTSTQLIALRSVAGLAASFCLPGAVGTVAHCFPLSGSPRRRSTAFAAMGGGQAVGFGLGLVLGGVCADTIGWRWGFYGAAIVNCIVLALAFWALPHSADGGPLGRAAFARFLADVDWVGALLISTSLALLSYELSVATALDAAQTMRTPQNIILLCTAVTLLPISSLWMHRQTRLGRPALIPNALWKNVPFTAVCVTVFLLWASLNASEQFTALYLEDVLDKSALTASLYFLPAPIGGAIMNAATASLLPRMRPSLAVPAACLVSSVATLLLAILCRVDGPGYWQVMFQAMLLNPLGMDMVYTIANLVVTEAFPAKTQALAGGIFNMLAQIGQSFGVATTAVIARHVTAKVNGGSPQEALLQGYKAGWWYNCALVLASVAVTHWGLKGVGRLGVKRD